MLDHGLSWTILQYLNPFVFLKTRDLLSESRGSFSKIRMGSPESFVELVQEKVDNPRDFSRVLTAAFQRRGADVLKFNVSHLYGLVYASLKSI